MYSLVSFKIKQQNESGIPNTKCCTENTNCRQISHVEQYQCKTCTDVGWFQQIYPQLSRPNKFILHRIQSKEHSLNNFDTLVKERNIVTICLKIKCRFSAPFYFRNIFVVIQLKRCDAIVDIMHMVLIDVYFNFSINRLKLFYNKCREK